MTIPMGLWGANTGVKYSGDQIHPNNDGYADLAGLINPLVNQFLPPPPSGYTLRGRRLPVSPGYGGQRLRGRSLP